MNLKHTFLCCVYTERSSSARAVKPVVATMQICTYHKVHRLCQFCLQKGRDLIQKFTVCRFQRMAATSLSFPEGERLGWPTCASGQFEPSSSETS